VDFVFDGNEIRGLEQNPDTKSRWAQMARAGKKVMQFLSEGRYLANVVDGKVTTYGKRAGTGRCLLGRRSRRRQAISPKSESKVKSPTRKSDVWATRLTVVI
jgi:hypothetical protein